MSYTLGVFLRPVTQDLGISRGRFSTGIFLASLTMAVTCPLLGLALDRWGNRKVLLPMVLGCALMTAALSLLQPVDAMIFAIFALWGVTAAGLSAVPFARAISVRFDSRRGIALGVAISGAGFGVAVVPSLAAAIIQGAGWRLAFVAYAIAVAVIAFLPIALLMSDPPRPAPAGKIAADTALPGLSVAETIRTRRFWALLSAFLFGIVAILGTVSHMTALLVDRGLPLTRATLAVSVVGAAAICGRLLCGWMLDQFAPARVAILFFLIPAVGVALIASGAGGPVPFIAAALLGLGVGGEVDMLAYFAGGYFGMKAFGRIYGLMFAVFTVGSGVGPFLSGMSFDILKSYDPAFIAYQLLLIGACALVYRLGPYTFPPRRHQDSATHATSPTPGEISGAGMGGRTL